MNVWLLVPVGVFLGWRFIECALHRRWLRRVPLRIHVNGIRGKSQTVELIVHGLQACGLRVVGKVTGVVPTLITPDGRRQKLRRLGPGSIAEQLSTLHKAARLDVDALVVECNAIEPELQRASQEAILQAQIGVITNVRQDHTDVFGPDEAHIARGLGETIPTGGSLLTAEEKHFGRLQRMAAAKGSTCVQVPTETVHQLASQAPLPSWVRLDNLELALSVCDLVGADLTTALEGMLSVEPPTTAWHLRKLAADGRTIYALNAFAANDPQSTAHLIDEAKERIGGASKLLVIFNHRQDRAFRVENLTPLLVDETVEGLYLIGDRIPRWRRRFPQAVSLAGGHPPQRVLKLVLDAAPQGALVVGMGNIGGAGLKLVELLGGLGEAI